MSLSEGQRIQVYGDRFSGNCYKIQLLLGLIGQAYDWVDIDILAGESRTPDFLALSQVGRIPIVILPDGQVLSESNAILLYFGEGTRYLPEGRLDRGRVNQWLFFEQYCHEPNIGTLRFWTKLAGFDANRRAQEPAKRRAGHEALMIMDRHLAEHPFMATDCFTVADIALFAYTHVAADGGFELNTYPAVQKWITRVRDQPGFTSME